MKATRLKDRRGFTLPEVLITVMILGILTAMSFVAVSKYQIDLKQREMDDKARMLFLACENHIAEMDVSGRLGNWETRSELKDEDGYKDVKEKNLGKLMEEAPQDAAIFQGEEAEWPDDRYYRIIFDVKNAGSTLDESIISEILPFGAIDDDTRTRGSYAIEYNLKDGTIYGVFFTDNANGLTADDIEGLSESYGRLSSDYRKAFTVDGERKQIGYYGGASTAKGADRALADPIVTVLNDEALTVTVTDLNFYNKNFDKVYDTRTKVVIKGVTSGAEKAIDFTISVNSGLPQQDVSADGSDYKYWRVGQVNNNLQYTLYLDNITKEGGHFAELYGEYGFIPGEDIIVEAEIEAQTLLVAPANRASAMTNSLFASSENKGGGNVEVSVSKVRHLENLNPDISGIAETATLIPGATERLPMVVVGASQTDDISWSRFLSYSENSPNGTIYGINGDLIATGSFFPIKSSTLTSYNGNFKEIAGIVIDGQKGLYGGCRYAGFFSELGDDQDILLKNMTLVDFQVAGVSGQPAGALISLVSNRSQVTVSNVLVMKSRDGRADALSISASGYGAPAGGLIGQSNAGSNLTVEGCAVAGVKVYSAEGNAGGLIGYMGGSGTMITNCYTSGMTENGEYMDFAYDIMSGGGEGTGAGGLIGFSQDEDQSIRNSYSTCSFRGYWQDGLVGWGFGRNLPRVGVINCYYTYGVELTREDDPFMLQVEDRKLTYAYDDYYRYKEGSTKRYYFPYVTVNSAGYFRGMTIADKVGGFGALGTSGKTEIPSNVVGVHVGDWRNVPHLKTDTKFYFGYREMHETFVEEVSVSTTTTTTTNYNAFGQVTNTTTNTSQPVTETTNTHTMTDEHWYIKQLSIIDDGTPEGAVYSNLVYNNLNEDLGVKVRTQTVKGTPVVVSDSRTNGTGAGTVVESVTDRVITRTTETRVVDTHVRQENNQHNHTLEGKRIYYNYGILIPADKEFDEFFNIEVYEGYDKYADEVANAFMTSTSSAIIDMNRNNYISEDEEFIYHEFDFNSWYDFAGRELGGWDGTHLAYSPILLLDGEFLTDEQKNGYRIFFNMDFGAAFEFGAREENLKLGTPANPYQIRNGHQLLHVVDATSPARDFTYNYRQTCEIVVDMGGCYWQSRPDIDNRLYFPANRATFSGSYDAVKPAVAGQPLNDRYNIIYDKNDVANAYGRATVLFSNISSGAWVKAKLNGREINQGTN